MLKALLYCSLPDVKKNKAILISDPLYKTYFFSVLDASDPIVLKLP